MTLPVIDTLESPGPPSGHVPRPRSARVSLLLKELNDQWENGQPTTARAYLDKYPELEADPSAALDLAYEEYCLRAEAGEHVNTDQFAAQFPRCDVALRKLIASHTGADKFLGEDGWPLAGCEFAGFRLLRKLGRGSFARVYFATETAIGDRPVVIKVAKQGGPEANILGQLSHPNIVPIHSIHQEPTTGMSVVCMPYHGKTTLVGLLRKAFSGRELPETAEMIREVAKPAEWEPACESQASTKNETRTYVDGILDLAIQLADALAFVHARNIFHRDLKPSNVLLTADGRPMLLDFNLSIKEQEKPKEISGTLGYLSPELLKMGLENYSGPPLLLDARSDIFSLGVILYELLAGVHPFGPLPRRGAKRLARHLLRHHADGPASLRIANPQITSRLAGVIERCLAPNAKDRFGSAAELASALRRCRSVPERVRGWAGRKRKLLAGAFAALAAGVVLLSTVLVLREPPSRRHYRDGVQAYRAGQYIQAVESFNKALADSDNAAAVLFGRGWAHLRNGQVQWALGDFEKADKLAGNGRTKASIAEALARVEKPRAAALIFWYEKALKEGFETAPLLNNLGTWYLKERGSLAKAEECLKKAIAADPDLQAAHENLALLELQRCLSQPRRDPKAGLDAARKALALGNPSADLYYDAACLCALAAKEDRRCADEALQYVAKAIEYGLPPQKIRGDRLFKDLKQDAQLETILRTPCTRQISRRNLLVALDIHFE